MQGPWTATGRVRFTDELPRFLTYVLPAIVLVGGWLAIRYVPPPVDTELRDELVEAMDERPAIVVVGNSITKAGIDPDQLGKDLGLRVALLTVPGSEAPAWFAVIKNVVLRADRKPRALVVANRADGLLAVAARTEQDRLRLDQLMTAHEPVLVAKVLDRDARSPFWSDFDRRRTQHRRAVLDHLRDAAAALAGWSSADAVSAHNRVFADDHLDYGLARDVWPPSDAADGGPAIADPEASLVVEMVRLANQHGVKIAFAHLPSAPGVPDLVTEEQMHDLLRLLDTEGAAYVARPRKPAPAAWFADPVHLRPVGRKNYTTFLGKRVRQLKLHLRQAKVPKIDLPPRPPAVTRSPLPPTPAWVPLASRNGSCAADAPAGRLADLFGIGGTVAPVTPGQLEARGLPPAWPVRLTDDHGPLELVLPAPRLRRKCVPGTFAVVPSKLSVVPRTDVVRLERHPDATLRTPDHGAITWVLPGTTLDVTAREPWADDRGPPAFELLAHSFGRERPPRIEIAGIGTVAAVSHGGLWRAVAQGGPRNWQVRVTSPRGGPLVALHSLTVGLGKHRTPFLASGRDVEQVAFDLVGRPRAEAQPSWPVPVPDVPEPVALVWNRDGTGHFEAPGVIDLTDRLTGRCSPLAVFEDGQPLERHTDCDDVRTDPGTQCHVGSQIRFHPRPGKRRRATYTLAYDRTSGRACQTAVWLLPGDEVRVSSNRQALRRFFAGPDELHLTARRFGPPLANEDAVTIVLRRAGATLSKTTVRLADLEDGLQWRLDRTLAPLGGPVEIAIRNHSPTQSVLFQKATLVEVLPPPVSTARATP